MLSAGTYRDRVTVQEAARVSGPTGTTTAWATRGERWARVVPLSVEARAQFGSLRGTVTHRVLLRGGADLVFGRHRLRWRGRTLELVEPPSVVEGDTILTVREVA
jgi:head-tail adaptor